MTEQGKEGLRELGHTGGVGSSFAGEVTLERAADEEALRILRFWRRK